MSRKRCVESNSSPAKRAKGLWEDLHEKLSDSNELLNNLPPTGWNNIMKARYGFPDTENWWDSEKEIADKVDQVFEGKLCDTSFESGSRGRGSLGRIGSRDPPIGWYDDIGSLHEYFQGDPDDPWREGCNWDYFDFDLVGADLEEIPVRVEYNEGIPDANTGCYASFFNRDTRRLLLRLESTCGDTQVELSIAASGKFNSVKDYGSDDEDITEDWFWRGFSEDPRSFSSLDKALLAAAYHPGVRDREAPMNVCVDMQAQLLKKLVPDSTLDDGEIFFHIAEFAPLYV